MFPLLIVWSEMGSGDVIHRLQPLPWWSVPQGEDQYVVVPLPQFCSSSRYIGHASEVTHGMYTDSPPKQGTSFLWFHNTGAAPLRSSPSSAVQAVLLSHKGLFRALCQPK